MTDLTNQFNEARQQNGWPPVTTHTIVQIHEGMRAGCGCEVISATGNTFTIRYRRETCRNTIAHHRTEWRQVVGDGVRNAVGSLFERPDVLPMTMPLTGLFPFEEPRND